MWRSANLPVLSLAIDKLRGYSVAVAGRIVGHLTSSRVVEGITFAIVVVSVSVACLFTKASSYLYPVPFDWLFVLIW